MKEVSIILCLTALLSCSGCGAFRPTASGAATPSPKAQEQVQVDLKQVQQALVKTVQETVQHTVTQSFNDLGEKQLVLEKQKLHEQRQTWMVAGASVIGLVIVLLALPSPALPMVYLIVAIVIGLILMGAPWLLLMFLP